MFSERIPVFTDTTLIVQGQHGLLGRSRSIADPEGHGDLVIIVQWFIPRKINKTPENVL